MFGCTSWLGCGICPAEFSVCSRCSIPVTEHFKNGNTATKVLRSQACIGLDHRQHSRETMCFAGEPEVGSGIRCLFGDLLKLCRALNELTISQMRFSKNQSGFANCL